ncbi:MAG: hypothetical protein GXO09_04995 [Crenarchaeota archaeon]|nr:hypothetical protein [Thermoproteota archaeon]
MEACIPLGDAVEAICYPRPGSPECRRVIAELAELGVECYLDYGRCTVGRLHMIGRGWAANVFLARMDGRPVAVKALRPDSRRRSVVWEAAAWTAAWWAGAAPEPYAWGLRVLVVEPVLGPRIEEYRAGRIRDLLYLLSRLLWKAYMLDRVGLLHGELARPHDHVLLRGGECMPEPFIVDYESSTLRRSGRSNLTQLVGGLRRLRGILGWLPGEGWEELRRILRRYRLGMLRGGVVEEVVGVVERYLRRVGGRVVGAEEEDSGPGEGVRVQLQGDS